MSETFFSITESILLQIQLGYLRGKTQTFQRQLHLLKISTLDDRNL